jgi:DNA repair protein SbcD/Mre11
MQLRFIHAADIHLGYEQYNLAARADDFARAYFEMVDYAIGVNADFVAIAGDLFHKANTDAWTLKQATAGLQSLREARIPAIVIEGNHDAQHYHKHLSWLEFLCDQELLYLLNVHRQPGGLVDMVPFDMEERRGSYVDVAGARIYGMKYHGAATARVLEQVRDSIEPGPQGYTVMMMHAGLEGQVPHLHGGLTPAQVEPLRPTVDYLALGHIHKRLMMEDWLYNPGSLETNSMEEMDWAHGFFDIEVDTSQIPKHKVMEIETRTLRPFRRLSINADDSTSVAEFTASVEEKVATTRNVPEGAVIEVHLGGVAAFRRQDVPLEQLKGVVEARFSPLAVRVRNNLVPPGIVPTRGQERLSRAELERRVVEQLVYQHAERRDQATAWAKLILDVKNMAAEKDLPASIADHVRTSLHQIDAEPSTDPKAGDRLLERDAGQLDDKLMEPEPEDLRDLPLTIAGEPIDGQPDSDSW